MAMTSDAKRALSSTIRGLRQRLLDDLRIATESAYRLSVRPQDAGLDEAARTKRKRLDSWLDEQVRAQAAGGRRRERVDFLREAEQQAAYTLLNRLVILRLMEEPGPSDQPLRKPALIKGGWNSRAYQDFRDLARGVVRDDPTEGFGFLLQLVCEELAEDLPGLFGSAGIGDLIPIQPATLRHAVEELNKEELETCWSDDMTLGWVYQYWNDPERERLDAKINDGGKIEPHEIASKTQMFTERYMVDWMLQNSLGLMWFTLCKKNGWAPEVQTNGTLQRLEERRIEWRAKRAAGEVSLIELMPLETEEERRWAYFLPGQEIPDEAVELAPDSVREWKILDPAVGSGHFLVVALGLLLALFQEEARHRGLQDTAEWSDRAIVEHLLAHTLHGIDIDPRAVQIAAASIWLKGKALCPEIEPEQLNLVAPNLRLADLPDDDPALAELRSDIEAETGIAGEFTTQILQALRGADHLGSLLKIDQAVDAAIERQERHLKALRAKALQVQPDLFGGAPPMQAEIDFSALEARIDIQSLLEQFLGRHSSANDLGLRLNGEQLKAGVRFVHMLKRKCYHLVIANPPYQDTSQNIGNSYIDGNYQAGKANLFSAFLLRGMELVAQGGIFTMLTMRSWLFLGQFVDLREHILRESIFSSVGDFDRGAFEDIPDEVVSVCASVIWGGCCSDGRATLAQCPTSRDDSSRDSERTARKRAATIAQEGLNSFYLSSLKIIPQRPIVYWWSEKVLRLYENGDLIGDVAPARFGVNTGNNARFIRKAWEVCPFELIRTDEALPDSYVTSLCWAPYIKGGGCEWIQPLDHVLNWRYLGMQLKVLVDTRYGNIAWKIPNEKHYFEPGVAFAKIGASFSGRAHRYRSIIDSAGSSVYTSQYKSIACLFNSTLARSILESLNPTVNFQVGDVNRLPCAQIVDATAIFQQIERSFSSREKSLEKSVEFT